MPSRAWHVCIHPPANPSPEAQGDISNAEPECWKLGEALEHFIRRFAASQLASAPRSMNAGMICTEVGTSRHFVSKLHLWYVAHFLNLKTLMSKG